MKRMLCLLLCGGCLLLLSSCKPEETPSASEPDTASQVQSDALQTSLLENEQPSDPVQAETASGEELQNDVTVPAVSDAVTDTVLTTEQPITIQDDVIIAPEYSLEIPEDFEIKSEGNDPLLENEQGTIQFNIMDKTKVVTNFEEYAKDTYRSASASGLANGELEEVTVNGITMKRFAMTMLDDDGVQLEAYAYLAQINNKVFMITLTSKDGGLADVAAADAFVAEIDFAAQ